MQVRNIVQEYLSKVHLNEEIIECSRIGGLTNQNYYVKTIKNEYVFRIAGENTSDYIDRDSERVNSIIATKIGIYPKDIYFDEKNGNKMSKFIINSKNFSELTLEDKNKSIPIIAKKLKELHDSGYKFNNNWDYFDELDKYLDLCKENKVVFFEDFYKVLDYILITKKEYYNYKKTSSPCHIDPLGENFLITEDNVYVIDWEYSGMHDKFWDLSGFILENELTLHSEEILIDSYIQEVEDKGLVKNRIMFYKIYQDFLWHLWGLYKFSLNEDFYDYAKNRFERSLVNLKKYEERYD